MKLVRKDSEACLLNLSKKMNKYLLIEFKNASSLEGHRLCIQSLVEFGPRGRIFIFYFLSPPVKISRSALWQAAVESFDLRYNLRFKIIGADVGVGGVKSIGSSDLSESEPKIRKIPTIYLYLVIRRIYFIATKYIENSYIFSRAFFD